MKRADAVAMGATLVERDGAPWHYRAPE